MSQRSRWQVSGISLCLLPALSKSRLLRRATLLYVYGRYLLALGRRSRSLLQPPLSAARKPRRACRAGPSTLDYPSAPADALVLSTRAARASAHHLGRRTEFQTLCCALNMPKTFSLILPWYGLPHGLIICTAPWARGHAQAGVCCAASCGRLCASV